MASSPPVGVVGLLFTDIEGSTRLARDLGSAWADMLAEHHAILRWAIDSRGGWLDSSEGDAVFATFAGPRLAAAAAVAAAQSLRARQWPPLVGELRVRMGLHVGLVERSENGYVGLEIHRAARIAAAAQGGQLLVSGLAQAVVGDALQVEDLGLHRLKDFPDPEHLFCAVIDGRGKAAFPPPRTLGVRPTNLPANRPWLVGRDDDVRRLAACLIEGSTRLLTVTGPGGSGKTSVALRVGMDVLDHFPGGVWWVPLTNVTDPKHVLSSVASVVQAGNDDSGDLIENVSSRFDQFDALLILDNVEHLLGAAPDIGELVDRSSTIRVLVTSQAPLQLTHEQVYHLGPLDEEAAVEVLTGGLDGPATPGDLGNPAERQAAAEVARQLDYLPLALSLAAPRLRVLTASQLRDRLATSAVDLLSGGSRDGLQRHQSLQATLDWTLDLLEPGPQRLFATLGVFAAPPALSDVEAVATVAGRSSVVNDLASLLDFALVRRIEEGDGVARFYLPEALRQEASARLRGAPEAARIQRAHAIHVEQSLARAEPPGFHTVSVWKEMVRLDADVDIALSWASKHDPALADGIAIRWIFSLMSRGRGRDVRRLLAELRTEPGSQPRSLRMRVLAVRSWLATIQGNMDASHQLIEQAIELASDEDPADLAVLLMNHGFNESLRGDHAVGLRMCARATKIAASISLPAWVMALVYESQVQMDAGHLDIAEGQVDLAAQLTRQSDAFGGHWLDTVRGDLAVARGDPASALRWYSRSLLTAEIDKAYSQVLPDLSTIGNCLAQLGRDREAYEVWGMAYSQCFELSGNVDYADRNLIRRSLAASHLATPQDLDLAMDRGRATPPGERGNRARAVAAKAAEAST